MQIVERLVPGYEKVVSCRDPESGLHAVIVIHDTRRGPGAGGCRMWPFASEEQALSDALKLAEGMSRKSAVARLPLGGAKSVILGDPARDKSEALLRAFGRCVEQLGGRYVVAEDVGIRVEDIEVMARETRHVAGRSGGRAASGDPSPFTAQGVHVGLRAAVQAELARSDLRGLRVAVQGVGSVGMSLCERLRADGAQLLVSDPCEPRAALARERLGAEVLPPDAIAAADCDVFAPCALGGVLDDDGVAALRARVVAGAANNQLASLEHGDALARRGVLYVPDFVINAGGIINVAAELGGHYDPLEVATRVDDVGERVAALLREATETGVPTHRLALRWAERGLAEVAPGQARRARPSDRRAAG